MQKLTIPLVKHLIATQFPQWKNLSITSIPKQGWDNRTFRLGSQLVVRLPSAKQYVPQVTKEQYWLPLLAPHLPLQIPTPFSFIFCV
jgi:aminoglycoside phosphotransferase (APT) family kinase protein